MESKYFVPKIEEMHVGCEFEMNDTWGGWKKLILTEELLKQPMVGLGSGNERSPWYWQYRVPYLTKEQIEAEGWKYIGTYSNDTIIFSKLIGNYVHELTFQSNIHKICVVQVRETMERVVKEQLFKGECKDINTFRTLCKLLGIM